MMDASEIFDNEIGKEIEVRIAMWNREREQLLDSAARVAQLDKLIAHATTQLSPVKARIESRKPKEDLAVEVVRG